LDWARRGDLSEIPEQLNSHQGSAEPEKAIVKKISDFTDKLVTGPIKLMLIISAVLLFVMMMVRVVDVGGRYFFKMPLNGADEAVGFLLLCVIACAFSYTQREKKHIRVEVLTEHLSKSVQSILDITNYVFSVVISGLITWQLAEAAKKFILGLQGGAPTSEILYLPWYPFYIILALGFAVYTLILLVDTVIAVARVIHK
jgi:TRAP-type transport system small permease protein